MKTSEERKGSSVMAGSFHCHTGSKHFTYRLSATLRPTTALTYFRLDFTGADGSNTLSIINAGVLKMNTPKTVLHLYKIS